MTISTWNPADKTANMTLTGSNLIATCSNASNAGVRGTQSRDTASGGKWQMKFTNVTLVDSLDYIGVGIAADTLGLAQGTQIQAIQIKDGTTFSGDGVGGSNALGTGAAIPGSATVDLCLDFVNMKFWFRTNGGLWLNTAGASPSGNVSGRTLAHTGIFLPYIRLTGTTATATFDGSPASPESGFTQWDGASTPAARRIPSIIVIS